MYELRKAHGCLYNYRVRIKQSSRLFLHQEPVICFIWHALTRYILLVHILYLFRREIVIFGSVNNIYIWAYGRAPINQTWLPFLL
jgi:hypothetical protein